MSGTSPLVDVQSVTKQTVLTRDVLDLLPTPRSIQAAGVLIPGVTMSATVGGGRDVGGSTKLQQPALTFHGNSQTIQRWDGFWLSNVQGSGTGGATSFYVNDSGAQELVYSTGAETMDMPTAGLYVNMIPKDGGNRFTGLLFADFTRSGWQSDNLTDALKQRGLTNVGKILHISDFNPGFGGPIKKDRLWYFLIDTRPSIRPLSTAITTRIRRHQYGGRSDATRTRQRQIPNQSVRMTWRSPRRTSCRAGSKPEQKPLALQHHRQPHADATSLQNTPYAQAMTLKWTRTQTSRLLFEAAPRGDARVPGALSAQRHRRSEQIHRPGVRSAAAQDLFNHRPGERQGVQQCDETATAVMVVTCKTAARRRRRDGLTGAEGRRHARPCIRPSAWCRATSR